MNQHIFLWRHIVNGRRTSNALEFCYLTNIPISKCGVVGVFFTLISKWCFFFSSDSIPIWKRNKLFVGMLKCVVELPFFIQVDIFFFFFFVKDNIIFINFYRLFYNPGCYREVVCFNKPSSSIRCHLSDDETMQEDMSFHLLRGR